MAANSGVDAGTIYSEVRIQLDKLSGDISKVQALFDKIPESAGKASAETQKKVVSSMDVITTAVKAAAASYALTAGLLKGIEFNKAAESAQVSFGVMLGSAEKAKNMLKEMKQYADTTPLEFKDIRSATQTMIQFGISGNDAMKYIKQLGDVSGGDAEKLQRLTLAFSQISAKGRLMGDDLRQMIEAGFNPLQEISTFTGRSMSDLTKEMEKGGISADMMKASFARVTAEGGKFYGMLAQNAGTLAGVQSTLNDATDTFLGKLTAVFTGPMKSGSLILTSFLNTVGALPAPILALAGTLAVLAAGFAAVGTGAAILAPALLPLLGVAAPFIAAGAAIVGVGMAIVTVVNEVDNYQSKLVDAVSETRSLKESADNIIGTFDKTTKSQKLNADQVASLIGLYPQLSGILKAGQTTLEEARIAYEKIAAAQKESAIAAALVKPNKSITEDYENIQKYSKALADARKSALGVIDAQGGLYESKKKQFKQEALDWKPGMSATNKYLQPLVDQQKQIEFYNQKLIDDIKIRDKLFQELTYGPGGFKPTAGGGSAGGTALTADELKAAEDLAKAKKKLEEDIQDKYLKNTLDRIGLLGYEQGVALQNANELTVSEEAMAQLVANNIAAQEELLKTLTEEERKAAEEKAREAEKSLKDAEETNKKIAELNDTKNKLLMSSDEYAALKWQENLNKNIALLIAAGATEVQINEFTAKEKMRVAVEASDNAIKIRDDVDKILMTTSQLKNKDWEDNIAKNIKKLKEAGFSEIKIKEYVARETKKIDDESNKEKLISFMSTYDKIGNYANQFLNALLDIQKTSNDNQIKEIQKDYDKQTKIIQKAYDDQIEATEKAYDTTTKAGQAAYGTAKELRDRNLADDLLAIETGLNASITAIDAETYATLKALGLQDLTKQESLQQQIDDAVKARNTEKANELKLQLQKQIILDKAEEEKKKIIQKAADDKILIQKNADKEALDAQKAQDAAQLLAKKTYDDAKLAAKKVADDAELAATKKMKNDAAKLEYDTAHSAWVMAGLAIQMNVAQAVMRAWASNAWPAALAETIVIGAIQTAQTAAWALSEPKLQTFNTGGIVAGSSYTGDRVPAMVNSGEMVLNADQQKVLFSLANGSGGGDGGRPMVIMIQLDGRKIAQTTADYINNGQVRIDA